MRQRNFEHPLSVIILKAPDTIVGSCQSYRFKFNHPAITLSRYTLSGSGCSFYDFNSIE